MSMPMEPAQIDSHAPTPVGGDGAGEGAPVSQSNPAAITAALVQATEARMAFMQQQMTAAGHAPPGV